MLRLFSGYEEKKKDIIDNRVRGGIPTTERILDQSLATINTMRG